MLCNVPKLGTAKTRLTKTATLLSMKLNCCCHHCVICVNTHVYDQYIGVDTILSPFQQSCICAPALMSRKIYSCVIPISVLSGLASCSIWGEGDWGGKRYHTKSRRISISSQLTSFYFSHKWDKDWGGERRRNSLK